MVAHRGRSYLGGSGGVHGCVLRKCLHPPRLVCMSATVTLILHGNSVVLG
jgi:hypothetical protein